MSIYEEKLIVERYQQGGHIQVVDSLPLRKGTEKITEYKHDPIFRERTYPKKKTMNNLSYEVRKYSYFIGGRGISDFMLMRLQMDENDFEKPLDIIPGKVKDIIEDMRGIEDIDHQLKQAESYEDAVEIAERVKEYQRRFSILKQIWFEETIVPIIVEHNTYVPFEFRYKPIGPGWFQVTGTYHGHIDHLISKRLEEENLGFYSLAWGGFILKRNDFNRVYELLKMFFTIPKEDVEVVKAY